MHPLWESYVHAFTTRQSTTPVSTRRSSPQWPTSWRRGLRFRLWLDGQIWEILPMGPWKRPSTSLRLHPGQKEKTLWKRSPNHFLRGFPVQTNAEHLGEYDFSTHPCGLPTTLRHRRCLSSSLYPTSSSWTWRSQAVQPRPRWFLHQHRPAEVSWSLAYAFGLSSSTHGCQRQRSLLSVYPGRSNYPGDLIKGRTFRRLNVTRKIIITDVPDLLATALNIQIGTTVQSSATG